MNIANFCHNYCSLKQRRSKVCPLDKYFSWKLFCILSQIFQQKVHISITHTATNISAEKYLAYCDKYFSWKVICIFLQIFFSITAAYFLCASRCSAWNDLWLLWLQNTSVVIINQFWKNIKDGKGNQSSISRICLSVRSSVCLSEPHHKRLNRM